MDRQLWKTKRTEAFFAQIIKNPFLPLVAKRKLIRMTVSEERIIKHKSGRPKKANRRDFNISIYFTENEYVTIKQNASKAGIKISYYIRQMALTGKITPRLNEEERYFVIQLIGMANNLNQLAKLGHQGGLLTVALMFEKYRSQLDELLKKLSKK